MTPLLAVAPLLALAYLGERLLRLAPRKPGYSQYLHSISELGEAGAPDQARVAWAVFLPIGLLFAALALALLLAQAMPPVVALAACIATGYIVAALFPCDPGSPIYGSARQAMHNLGGAVEYAGGGFSLIAIAEQLGEPFKAAGFIVLAATVGLTVLPAAAGRGLIQRVAECVLFVGCAAASWRVLVG